MPLGFASAMLAGGDTLSLSILDFIGEDWWDGGGITDKLIHRALAAAPGAKLIKITMNSPGGDAFMGITIANLLRAHAARKELDVLGMCASAATLIALACDDVRMGTGSQMMIHEASGVRRGKAMDMRAGAQELQNLTESAIDAYAAKTKKPRHEMARMVADETWFSAAQAVEIGLADGLIDRPKVTASKAMASHALAMRSLGYRNAPAEVASMMVAHAEQHRAKLWKPSIQVGDRVQVRAGMEHAPHLKDAIGTVRLINTAALGVEFDGMGGDIHRWFVEDELQQADAEADDSGMGNMVARSPNSLGY